MPLRQVDTQPLDAARIGIQYLELNAGGMADHFAPRGNSAGECEHNAAQRIDIFFLLIGDEVDSQLILKFLNR